MCHFAASIEWQVNFHQNTGLNSLKKMLFHPHFYFTIQTIYNYELRILLHVYGIGISLPNQPVTR